MELKTKTASSVEFTTNVSSNHDSGKFLGTLETKYKWKDYGKSLLPRSVFAADIAHFQYNLEKVVHDNFTSLQHFLSSNV